MLKKIIGLCMLMMFLFQQPANASFSDDVAAFEGKYPEIYSTIDPALTAKMEIYLQDVVYYVVINYNFDNSLNVQIKNAVASVLLTGETYKNDLLPFLLEQSENRELYQAQLTEMKAIVRKEVLVRLVLKDPPATNDIPDNSLILGQDIFFITNTNSYNFSNSLIAAATGSNIYYKFNGHWFNLSDGSITKFSDYFNSAKFIDSSFNSWKLRKWFKSGNTIENFIMNP